MNDSATSGAMSKPRYLFSTFATGGKARRRLVVVGDGPEEQRLRTLVSDFFAGAFADPRDAYRAFDFFAMSSRTE